MQVIFVILVVTTVAAALSCTDTNPSCTNWVANGFCASTFYTDAQKTQYCAASCGMCSGGSSTTGSPVTASSASSCLDASASCAAWAKNGFCTSTFYTDAYKQQYCPATCSLCGGSGSASTTAATATTSA